MEKAGFISERCEINRQIKRDNALIRALKAAVVKLKKAVETTMPAIAKAMEQTRQNIIVFTYCLLHIRGSRKDTAEYVEKATVKYNNYLALRKQMKARIDERRKLQTELDSLSVFSVGKRKELKTKIAELSEEMEELRFEEKTVMAAFDKEDAAGMKQVKGEISQAETRVAKLDEQEGDLIGAVNREKEKFDGLKEQAADLDQDELTDARLALRPQMEREAHNRISKALSSGKVSFWNYQASVRDVDELLGEEGMEKRKYREQKKRKMREITRVPLENSVKPKGQER